MLGAIIGDIVGSIYEFQNTKSMDFDLISPWSNFTDDSVMTLAVAKWLVEDEAHTIHYLISLVSHFNGTLMGRYLEMVDVIDAILRIIFVSQISAFLLMRLKCSMRIRLRILLWARRLRKRRWLNLFMAWALSSFVLTSYWYVICFRFWILAIIPYFLFSVIYLVIVFKEKLRERWLSGLKAIYFYLIASIGQIIGLCIYYVAYILKWYSPYYEYTGFMWDFLGYKTYIGKEGDSVLLNGMFELAICMAIPYLFANFANELNYCFYG